ncbi:MAG: carboxymuconolactone decarboxylase family protein [Acidimicrobiales bacterium]
MSRLPYVQRQDLDVQTGELWDGLATSRSTHLVNEEGGLMGPFNAWVTAPELGRRLVDLGTHLRFGTSINRRLLELAIVTVAAHWKAEFEWWAHAAMARRHGVPDEILEALSEGKTPQFGSDDERIVYAVARQLVTSGGLDPATYEAARSALGDAGMVELVSLCGFYTLVSFTLNAFAVPLPPDAKAVWSDEQPAPHA